MIISNSGMGAAALRRDLPFSRETSQPGGGSLRYGLGLALILLVVSVGCSEVRLGVVDTSPFDRVAVRGEFCTSHARALDFPVKILFAVDSSDGMISSDPADLHVDAIETVVNEFSDSPSVTFGIIRWGQRVVLETLDYDPPVPAYFTRDRTILDPAFARMRQPPSVNPDKYLGGTDYMLALDEIESYLQADQATGGYEPALYFVVFMTDGMPQSGTADPNQTRQDIVDAVAGLSLAFDLRMDVISIVQATTIPAEFFGLLPEMAELGNGTYVQLTTPKSLPDQMRRLLGADHLLVEYDLEQMDSSDNPKSFFVRNVSAKIESVDGVVDLYADSDRDGIVDVLEEEQYGTNPVDPDTDGDGLPDLFEIRLLSEFSPTARVSPPLSAEELSDVDGDGLNLFLERRLGTDPRFPDTDEDGVSDYIEYREGTSPILEDMRGDLDADGVSNGFELRQGSRVDLEEPADIRARFSYTVAPVGAPYAVFDGRRCYQILVENIALASTRSSFAANGDVTPGGYNEIELSRLETAVNWLHFAQRRPGRRRVVSGKTWMIYRPQDEYRDPWTQELMVRDANFHP